MMRFEITFPGRVYTMYAMGRNKAISAAAIDYYGEGKVKVKFSRYAKGAVVYTVTHSSLETPVEVSIAHK